MVKSTRGCHVKAARNVGTDPAWKVKLSAGPLRLLMSCQLGQNDRDETAIIIRHLKGRRKYIPNRDVVNRKLCHGDGIIRPNTKVVRNLCDS